MARRSVAIEKYRKGDSLSGKYDGYDFCSFSPSQNDKTPTASLHSPKTCQRRPTPPQPLAAPRVSVQAFCETVEIAAPVQAAGEDRRLGKAHGEDPDGRPCRRDRAHRSRRPRTSRPRIGKPARRRDLDGLDSLAEACHAAPASSCSVTSTMPRPIASWCAAASATISSRRSPPLDVVRSICSLFSASDAMPSAA